MSKAIDNALNKVISDAAEEGFIACRDKQHQESIRVMTFNRKRKLPIIQAENITICKVTETDGSLWVKVYKKPDKFYVRNEEGKLVPFIMPYDPVEDIDLQRQLELMTKDGCTEEELLQVTEEFIKRNS